MRILKPPWVIHDDNKPIFSVDIHPKGLRFATGGQGGEGGRVVIWNLAPVLNEEDEMNPKIPKMLCQMDNHLSCVNVVRWSCEGHLLASAGDDKLVMIWKLTGEGSSSVFGSRGKINVETWKCVSTLNSHSGDILDVAWAPHDAWLASGSVDNTVIIWNMHKLPEKVAVLKGHTGMVKGVTWDPIGKYLASQSDDRTLRIWRTADWVQQEVVSDCFLECSATTHILRLSWSPEGQYLVSAHAMNGGGPTAQIIERFGWKQDKDFVGHRKAVTCVRFSSNLMKKGTKTRYCCLAIGSRDRSLSIWLTSLKRPLVVIKELFDDSVLDITWNSNGCNLLACSSDGTVACLDFTPEEIGKPLSLDEKNSIYERLYGKSLQRNWNQSFTGSQIIENPELLIDIDEDNDIKSVELIANQDIQKPLTVEVQDFPKANETLIPANKQIETRLPSGKRRITPMFLTPTSVSTKESMDVPLVNTSTSKSFSTSSPTKSKIIVETVKETDKKITAPRSASQASKISSDSKLISQAPGIQLNQQMCTEVPGDQPIVHFINLLEPLKLYPGTSVTKKTTRIKMQITNSCNVTSRGTFSKIEVFKNINDNQPNWETFLGSPIKCITANHTLIVACCEDLTINCFLVKSGARAWPSLVIEDLVIALNLNETSVCLILTKTGLLYMWDFKIGKTLLNRISVRSLLSSKATVISCIITEGNTPLIVLSDGRAYTHSSDFNTWTLLSNPLDPVNKAGGSLIRGLSSSLPLASLQRSISMQGTIDTLPSGITLSFLESQITTSYLLRSSVELKHWLLATINYLLEKGPECRLRSILDDLIEPPFSTTSLNQKTDVILDLSKKQLLLEILQIIKTKLPWQRLYQEYNELVMMDSV